MTDRQDTTYVNVDVQEYQKLAEEILSVIREPIVWTRAFPTRDVGGYGIFEYKWYINNER